MLGTRIAALRREAGLSQAELAQRLQVSPSALGMYEQERREPSMQTLVKLSRELGVTTDYLLTGTPAEKEREELEEMLLALTDGDGNALYEQKTFATWLKNAEKAQTTTVNDPYADLR